MSLKIKNFLSSICIFDNFISDVGVINKLKEESVTLHTVEGQDHFNLTECQRSLFNMVNSTIVNYCIENDIDFMNLEFNNFQKGRLLKYEESMVTNHLYEPHHDIAEAGYITAIYYIDSDYSEEKWVGGELAIYEKLSFVDYPGNTVNILPKPNRLIIFPGFYIHRVKPYFGNKPRTSIVMGWGVINSVKNKAIII